MNSIPTPPATTMKHHTPALPAMSALLLCSLLAMPAWAHEGHGLPGMAHWHGTDVLGFVGVAALAAAVAWFRGGK